MLGPGSWAIWVCNPGFTFYSSPRAPGRCPGHWGSCDSLLACRDSQLPAIQPPGLSGSGWRSPGNSEDAGLLGRHCGRFPQRMGQAPFHVSRSHVSQLCRRGSELGLKRSCLSLSSAIACSVDLATSLRVWVSASVQGEVPSQAPASATQSSPRALGPTFPLRSWPRLFQR